MERGDLSDVEGGTSVTWRGGGRHQTLRGWTSVTWRGDLSDVEGGGASDTWRGGTSVTWRGGPQ